MFDTPSWPHVLVWPQTQNLSGMRVEGELQLTAGASRWDQMAESLWPKKRAKFKLQFLLNAGDSHIVVKFKKKSLE